jgi:hypothetical protein
LSPHLLARDKSLVFVFGLFLSNPDPIVLFKIDLIL